MRTRWCFTVNADAEEFYQNLEQVYERSESLRYICGQLEQGTTGNIHFQGYLQLKRSQRLAWLKQNVSDVAHFEFQRAKYNDEARDYTRKSETSVGEFVEFGEYNKGRCPGGPSGTRTDLIEFAEAIRKGSNMLELVEEGYVNEIARFPKFYSTIRSLEEPERGEIEVYLYFGSAGTGKTRKAREENPGLYTIPLSNGTFWADGYDGQEVALLDDFCGKKSKVSLDFTLRLLDRYPCMLPIKGGFTWWIPKKVIVTTNIHPANWYEWIGRKKQWASLKRRFTGVIVFSAEDQEPEVIEDLEQDFFEEIDLIVAD